MLKQELSEINQLLPAAVYIPLNGRTSRKSAVLHIPISEVRVFTTKERAPYLICVEIFKPFDELNEHVNYEEERSGFYRKSRAVSAPDVRGTFWENSLQKYIGHEFMTGNDFDNLMKKAAEKSTVDSIVELEKRKFFTVDTTNIATVHYAVNSFHNNSIAAVYDVNEAVEGQNNPIFKESAKEQSERLREQSPFGELKTWQTVRLIIKSGDDLRQEQFAMQLISLFNQTFVQKRVHIWLYPYDIVATGPNCGILECVPDAVSIDGLKKALPPNRKSLLDFFNISFGSKKSRMFKRAKQRFMNSLAGYSLVCYVLQIKDRHNGNILIDRRGHIIHIDFGFLLSNSPGGNMNFESAPFKLTHDFEQVLGGRRSKTFMKFRQLCVKGFIALSEITDRLANLVEMMRIGLGASLPCFIGGEEVAKGIRQRLVPRPNMDESDYKEYVNSLIDKSLDNWHTQCYDRCQYCCQNILY